MNLATSWWAMSPQSTVTVERIASFLEDLVPEIRILLIFLYTWLKSTSPEMKLFDIWQSSNSNRISERF